MTFLAKKERKEELDHFHENWESLIRPFFISPRNETDRVEEKEKKKK